MIVMALVYIFGMISGLILAAIIIGGWVLSASRKLKERKYGAPTRPTSTTSHPGVVSMEGHASQRRRGRSGPHSSAA